MYSLPEEQNAVVRSDLIVADDVTDFQPNISDEGQYWVSALGMSVLIHLVMIVEECAEAPGS